MKRLAYSVWFLAGLVVLLNACVFGGSSSNAASSAWEPFLVLKAPHAPAASLAAVTAADRKFQHEHGWYEVFVHEAVAATVNSPACPGIGTVSPPDSADTSYHATSCTGVLYQLSPCPRANTDCVVQGLAAGQAILFDTAGCTGNMAVTPNFQTFGTPSISDIAVIQGIVFRYDPGNLGASDPTTYLMVAPATPPAPFTVQSEFAFEDGGCKPVSGVTLPAYPVVANDPSITGMASATIPGPVSVGAP